MVIPMDTAFDKTQQPTMILKKTLSEIAETGNFKIDAIYNNPLINLILNSDKLSPSQDGTELNGWCTWKSSERFVNIAELKIK